VGGHILAFINNEYKRELQKPRNDPVCGIVLRAIFPLVSERFRYGTYETWHAVATEWGDADLTNFFLAQVLKGVEGT